MSAHERVREVFFEALEIPKGERSAFLDRTCAGDAELRSAVDRLLRADEDASQFLLPDLATRSSDAADRIGTQLGPYALKSVLGMGGMGTVYLAERADEEFHKTVAIKVLRRGLDTEHVLHRFRVEREVLAQLEHPGIARLIDSGTTDDGLPYLVMEHVDGVALDVFVAEQKLPLRQRLQLFREICNVVGFAHRNLVVHRDLKPGNILVDRDGRVRLLDFGISKILDTASLPASLAITHQEWRAFTPEYASPEQVQGQPVSTAADVYSLGVLLYELLSGVRPYLFKTRAAAEVSRLVCDTEPAPPSREAQPSAGSENAAPCGSPPDATARALAGDLDGIVMKALRKEPDRRYGTVVEMSDDVGRYLQGLPVTALGDTWTYRSAKFMGRHRMALGIAGVVITLLLASSTVVSVQATRIATERNRATREAATARRTIDLLKQTFLAADPFAPAGTVPSDSITARQMLQDATRRIRFEIPDEPLVRAELLDVIGQVRLGLAQYDVAESLMTEALAAREQAVGEHHPDVARSLVSLARLDEARGEPSSATLRLDRARAIMLENRDDASPEMAEIQRLRGAVASRAGDLVAAEEALDDALRIVRASKSSTDRQLAAILLARAGLAWEHGDYATTLKFVRESVEATERAYGPDHPALTAPLELLSTTVEEATHDYRGAQAIKRRVHDIRRRYLGDDHPSVANSLYNLGYSNYLLANLDSARVQLKAADALMQKTLGAEHVNRSYTLGGLGLVEGSAGHFDESIAYFHQAIRIIEGALGERHRIGGILWMSLGTSEWGAGRRADAETHMRHGFAIVDETPEHRTSLWGTLTLAALLASKGEQDDAASLFARTGARADELRADAELCFYTAGYWASSHEADSARVWLEHAIAAGSKLSGAEHHPALGSMHGSAQLTALIDTARR